MKKIFVFVMMFCLAGTLSFAQVPPPAVNTTTNSASTDTVKPARKAKGKKHKRAKKQHKKNVDDKTADKTPITNSTN